MEWTVAHQIQFLFLSVIIGSVIGFLFELFGGFWRGKAYRRFLFVSDVFLCAFAAILTFFSALVLSNGQMHPVMHFGILLGLVVEHFTIGRVVSNFSCKVHRLIKRGKSSLCARMNVIVHLIRSICRRINFIILSKKADLDEGC